jgi:antitoxin ParD1/3/4
MQAAYHTAMNKLNISLSDALKAFVEEQAAERGLGSGSEYVRELIEQDAQRIKLRVLLLEGAESERETIVDDAYFSKLRARICTKE